ncbi:protein FRG1 homolog [Nilaparvata lugens]|uniref:protein FRG1 homolog n=1 Tax=Nilaparvata lugens TaxID=108931 RepID=UPI000B98B912|nr:protein FRG1 homolog [Nilaparvata lugens]
MSEYEAFKRGKLVLKGEKSSSKRKRKHKHQDKKEEQGPVADTDAISHGGWWSVDSIRGINGSVALEFGDRTYVTALDNGLFTLGAPHDEGEGPSPEEVLTAISVNDTKVAFKSGYGKYLGVAKDNTVTGRSDAIGALEQWEPVFQDGKLALLSCTGKFMSIRNDDDTLVAISQTAGENEMVKVRSSVTKETDKKLEIPVEEQGSLAEIEVNYVKKFQKFQDKRLKVSSNSVSELKRAKTSGSLHETLLDRRSKMKADRYCK